MKVLVAEKIAQEGIEHLKINGFDVDVKLGLGQEDLSNIISQYDALIVRSATKANAQLIERANNLKVIGRAGVGVDNIDVPACTKRGIIVVNTPDGNSMAAAELAVALAFSISRNIPQAYAAGKYFKDFRRNKFVGTELDGKVAGVIGMGKIGSIVASKLKGINMRVIAYDPYLSDEKYKKLGVDKCNTLEELLKQADLLTIHMPKTDETYGMIGESQFAICKKGVKVINAARGGLVNEKALYNAIKNGIVSAAGIDVLDPEPNYTKNPEEQDYTNALLELDNVVALPHLGASTEEANYNVGVLIAYSVADALKGNLVQAVNMRAY
jgi:D-3-phosphoglycerate dehydrogenase